MERGHGRGVGLLCEWVDPSPGGEVADEDGPGQVVSCAAPTDADGIYEPHLDVRRVLSGGYRLRRLAHAPSPALWP